MVIVKREGQKEEFNSDKIKRAIEAAFKSVGYSLDNYDELVDSVAVWDGMNIEDIQDQVIETLRNFDYNDVADAYLIYRYKHKQARLIKDKLNYIYEYANTDKSATDLSNTDDNANSSNKNAASLEGEIYKDLSREIQRSQMKDLLDEINSPFKEQYAKDLEHHILYQHDESCPVLKPYCSAYTMYPFLVEGTSNIDGTKNHAPKHLSSFVGQFQNLVFLLSSQKKGAGAYGEFFNIFSYFCEKEWGENYWQKEDVIVTSEHCREKRTIGSTIDQYFQSITHYINQPAGNRGSQSPFTNFNVFDSYYWHSMFDDFYFPDGTQPHWEAVNWLQKRYMKWLNEERTKTLLTFPVMTVCLLTDGTDVKDKEYKDFVTTQWAEGDSFFVYLSDNADSISSCCRLRNEITENTFSSTTGMTGVQTGSCNVMTLNLNRIVQDYYKDKSIEEPYDRMEGYLHSILDRVYDYQKAYKTGLYKMDKAGLLPQTKAGYISLDKLYCTIGVNGLNEAARFLGFTVSNNEDYMNFVSWILGTIKDYNKEHSTKKFKFNLELVPAESLGVKNYNWDKKDEYWVPEDKNLYNSYIYDAHDNTSVLDKIAMQGGKVAKSIDGGQASHINLQENLSKEQYTKLLEYAIKVGNSYITFNVPQTQCDDCGFIAKHPFDKCPECGSEHTTQWTRIIGYLRPISAFSSPRKKEQCNRTYSKTIE